MSCIKTFTENISYEYKYISMFRHQRQQHLNISLYIVLNVLYFCVFTLVHNKVFWVFTATASTFWVTAVALATWCNALILLDGPCFRFAKLNSFVGLVIKKNICFSVVRMFAVCGSIHSNLVLFQRVISSDIYAQCGKAFKQEKIRYVSAYWICAFGSKVTAA